jgi:hypothetical protein
VRHSFVSRWVLASAIFVLAQTIHCGDDHGSGDAVLVDASDEAYTRVSERIGSAMVSMTSAAQMTSPMSGASVPSSPAPTFSWSLPNAYRLPSPARPNMHASPAIVFAFREALAHGAPTTGDVFLLEISTSASSTVKLFTTRTSWQIDDASWSKLKSGGSAATIKIYNAFVNNNVIEEGPFMPASPTTFTIAP